MTTGTHCPVVAAAAAAAACAVPLILATHKTLDEVVDATPHIHTYAGNKCGFYGI